jgi:hypothetical protein
LDAGPGDGVGFTPFPPWRSGREVECTTATRTPAWPPPRPTPAGATTIRFADYETKVARFSWREAQIQRPEIKLPRLDLGAATKRDRIEP